jgi:hypothetical protein
VSLTALSAKVRREAEAEALLASQDTLARELDRLDAQREAARAAAKQREEQIRATVAQTTREVRASLAADVYGAFTPIVRAWLNEPSRKAARDLLVAFDSFKERCKVETGHELGARPVTNIMLSEIDRRGVAGYVASSVFCGGMIPSLINLEGSLTMALGRGVEVSAVEKLLGQLEDSLAVELRNCKYTPNNRHLAQWEATRTALSGLDHSQLLASFVPPPKEDPGLPPGNPDAVLSSGPDGYKPTLADRVRARLARAAADADKGGNVA